VLWVSQIDAAELLSRRYKQHILSGMHKLGSNSFASGEVMF
jgi:hypothetical protein